MSLIVVNPDCQKLFRGHIDVHGSENALRRHRAAGGEQIEILRNEGGSFLLIGTIQGQHSRLPKLYA